MTFIRLLVKVMAHPYVLGNLCTYMFRLGDKNTCIIGIDSQTLKFHKYQFQWSGQKVARAPQLNLSRKKIHSLHCTAVPVFFCFFLNFNFGLTISSCYNKLQFFFLNLMHLRVDLFLYAVVSPEFAAQHCILADVSALCFG